MSLLGRLATAVQPGTAQQQLVIANRGFDFSSTLSRRDQQKGRVRI
jgi:hypothetical protein